MNLQHAWTQSDRHGWTVCIDCGAIREFAHEACDPVKKTERTFARLEGKHDFVPPKDYDKH